MLFDTYNPWAALIQLNSTHPLTGRRVAHLGEIAKAKGQSFGDYDVEAAARRVHLDRGKLWGQFLGELLLLLAPILFGLAVAIMGAWQFVPAAIAAGVVATLPLHYPFGAPSGTTVMALMSDAAASPVRGQPVRLEGKAIGQACAAVTKLNRTLRSCYRGPPRGALARRPPHEGEVWESAEPLHTPSLPLMGRAARPSAEPGGVCLLA
ncbi:MAG TPA: hypothetical protein DCQ79_07385 [Rhizobiales bacterium]|nr:hypothetical protein [Hyphomicrobiales bacterium]